MDIREIEFLFLVLLALILVLVGLLTVLQQRTSGIQLRFRGLP